LSSILKALKKIEQEGIEKHSEKVWPDSLQSMKEKEKRIRFKKNTMFFVFLFIVISIFSGGLIFYLFQDSTQTLKALNKVKKHKVSLNQKKEAGVGRERFALSEKKILPDNMRSIKKKIPEFERKPMPEQGLLLKNIQKSINVETIPVIREEDDKTFLPNLKDDPRIELQALVWAADAKDSFAVINNRIFREGQTFDGVTVTKIDKDEVSFRDGRNEWREKFRIK
jgi:hypothetical protein